MKSLMKTSLFEMQDGINDMKTKLLSYNPKLDDVNPEQLEEQLNTIKKRFAFPLKNKVLDDINNGKVILVYNKDRISIPTYIPAYLFNLNGTPVSIVNITNYATKAGNGDINIDTRKLFALAQTGSILLGCYNNWNRISMNQLIVKLGAQMYSQIFTKVLDKMFAVNLDPIKSDKVKFITAKFFLLNLLGKANSETVFNSAYAACTNGTTRITMQNFDSRFTDDDFLSLDKFIKAIATNVDGINALTMRSFVDTYFKMYGTSALFAMEFFPYFCHMLFSVAVGAHLNSEYLIENIVGKELDKFYNEVSNIIR